MFWKCLFEEEMNLTISINGQNLEDFYIRDEDDSESPPMVSAAQPN